jgi:hypothetical protein
MTQNFKLFLCGVGVLLIVGVFGATCSDGSASKAAATAPLPRELNLAYEFSPGAFFNHDFYITNTCGEDLTEVHISFQFVGENASPTVDRYWASWPLGGKQQIQVPVDKVSNVQRITIRGRADQGVFDEELVKRH